MSAITIARPAPADVEKRRAICAHAFEALGKFCSALAYHKQYSVGTPADPGEVYNVDELFDEARAALMFLDADTARVVERFLDAADLLDETLYPNRDPEHYGRSVARRQLATALVVALVGYPEPPAPAPVVEPAAPKEVPF